MNRIIIVSEITSGLTKSVMSLGYFSEKTGIML